MNRVVQQQTTDPYLSDEELDAAYNKYTQDKRDEQYPYKGIKTSMLNSILDSMKKRGLVDTEESRGIQDEINSRNGVFRPQ